MVKFSLLMCIYEKENPQYLKECLESVNELTVKPDEVVIVKDGPLTDELENVLSKHDLQGTVNIVALPENVTLGPARAAGVEAAKNDWVAIMDTDDICRKDRFEKQLQMIENNPELGLIGGQIAEFSGGDKLPLKNNSEGDELQLGAGSSLVSGGDICTLAATRTVPIEHKDILRYVKTRTPFNHMTVMFKRDAALKAGNYRYFPLFEDYDLWTRMIKNGTICANHKDVLVNARTGSDTYSRRRGVNYIKSEWQMQRQLKKLGLIKNVEFIRNVTLRIPVRLLPSSLLAGVYKKFLR